MNLKQAKINECLNLVRIGNRKQNEIRFSSGESKEHISAKKILCGKLEAEDHNYITEAIFKTGGIADILVLDQFKAIEIAHSESDESLHEKSKYYPQGISIEVIRC